jgi:hypothetical protein
MCGRISGAAMLKDDWNGLRVGCKVLVHDHESDILSLIPGVVAAIDRRKAANRLGIRPTVAGNERKICWPTHVALHLDPPRPTEHCWRCDVVEAHTDPNGRMSPRTSGSR